MLRWKKARIEQKQLLEQSVDTLPVESREEMQRQWRHHEYALLRMSSSTEKKLRRGGTALPIPKFSEMTMAQWQRNHGPQLVLQTGQSQIL